MRIPRVYTDQTLHVDTVINLNGVSTHYLGKVLRMQAGRALVIFNGLGGEYQATITQLDKKILELHIDSFNPIDRESPLSTEIAIGISRGERMDHVLQKATELGVTRIVPITTERTEVRLNTERAQKKWQHWRQITISACEQSQRNKLPQLAQITPLTDYLTAADAELKFVLHHRDSKGLPTELTPGSAALLIGPEGGLSDSEIFAARGAGFNPLTLGPRVMRTETAPVAAISVLQYQWGDFSS